MNMIDDQLDTNMRIAVSVLASDLLTPRESNTLVASLKKQYGSAVIEVAKGFGGPALVRKLKLTNEALASKAIELSFNGNLVSYEEKVIGKTQILYKSPIPGELQARLAVESAMERFLEYLQKVHKIVVLNESDRHVQVFIPSSVTLDFLEIWQVFLREIAFSAYGKSEYSLAGLVQTFIVMLNAVTLSGRGFSTLDVPVLTQDQANVLAAWYYAVIRDVGERQRRRQQQIDTLQQELDQSEFSEKDRKAKLKELQDKQAMQDKEAQKYQEFFKKSFAKALEMQHTAYQQLEVLKTQLAKADLPKSEQKKLLKQQEKLNESLIFSRESVKEKLALLGQCSSNPFEFVRLNQQQHPEKFQIIKAIAKNFDRKATDQINSTRGDIFTQCLTEMYRLLEMQPEQFDPLPEALLSEHPVSPQMRSPGDDSREFCYSCGIALNPRNVRWQVLRFMFERPSQRRQSSFGEGRPHICNSCSALSFASPLKVTEESIIVRLDSNNRGLASEFRIKDYLRMLTNKEIHLSSGRYLILTSDRAAGGDLASQKLGQVQYALAKIASIFPSEVLADFKFSLIIQGNQIPLLSRHLLFTKGLIDCYSQTIVVSGKEINMVLGDAIRYVQQDLPFLADYTVTKKSNFSDNLQLEKMRRLYWSTLKNDLHQRGETMDSDSQLSKRARLYRDVAALTGLTYAFAQFLENTAKNSMKQEDAEREVSKLIEKVDDAIAFSYYATLGDEKKTSVQARLYHSPDCDFIYSQAKALLEGLNITDREGKDDKGKIYLQFYADDISRIYQNFATKDYAQEKDWKELTYNLKLSLYTRFPELVRKLKSTSEKN